MINVFIDGAAGTTGLKIHEYFSKRDDINILNIEEENRKSIERRAELIEQADVSFLCLPDAASKEIAQHVSAGSRIIDTSTAHRTNDAWVYGFPELCKGQKELIKNSNRVANPGCHATGAISIIRPLIESGLAGDDYPFAITSLTGYSGGGKKMIADYENPERSVLLDSPAQYGIAQVHKHIPEIMKMTGVKYQPTFMPIVADYFSGMEVSVPILGSCIKGADQMAGGAKAAVIEMFKDFYSGSTMIEVVDSIAEGGLIYSNAMAKSNKLKIAIDGTDDNILITALFDNLGKGASGAAVQNMNIMMGIEESKGLL